MLFREAVFGGVYQLYIQILLGFSAKHQPIYLTCSKVNKECVDDESNEKIVYERMFEQFYTLVQKPSINCKVE